MNWAIVFEVAVGLVAIIAAIYGVIQFIDSRSEKKINDETFLRKISASLRPLVIFDEHGSVLLDRGAMAVVKVIEIKHEQRGGLPREIVISPNRHLSYTPLLETLENESINVKTKRGKLFDWHYELDYQMYNDIFDGKRRYRIEIIL